MTGIKLILSDRQKKITFTGIFIICNLFTFLILYGKQVFLPEILYIPLILTAIRLKRRTLILIILFETSLILFYYLFINKVPTTPIYIRIAIFIIMSLLINETNNFIKSKHKNVKKNLNRITQIFNGIGNGLRLIDKDFNILLVNKPFTDLTGLSTEEVLQKKCYEVFTSNICNTPDCCLKKIMSGKTMFEIDATKKLKDGSDFFCILHTVPFYGKGGEFIGIIEDCKPITKRKQIENKLIETKNYLESLINYANAPIIIWNPDLEITKFNHAAELLTGYKEEEIKHEKICLLFPEGSRKESMDCINITKKGEFLKSVEISILCKNGDIKTLLWNSSNIYDKDNKTHLATIAQGQDISERKQTQEKILKTIIKTEEKERTRLAKNLHDDLGTLLSSINIYLGLLKSGNIEKPKEQNILNYTKGLIDQAIVSTKEIANNLKPNIINRFGLIPAITSYCKKINETGIIKITYFFDVKHQLKKDYEISIYRILNELITNTLKHASAQNININIFSDNKSLILSYQDDGIGFNTEEIINRGQTDGTGLQNIISRIKVMKGKYEFENTDKKGIKMSIKI